MAKKQNRILPKQDRTIVCGSVLTETCRRMDALALSRGESRSAFIAIAISERAQRLVEEAVREEKFHVKRQGRIGR